MQRVSSLATNRLICWSSCRSASVVASRRAISSTSVSLSRGWCIDGGNRSSPLFSNTTIPSLNNNNRLVLFNQFSRGLASYPSHIKVRLPALSPTMEQGTLAKWAKKEGDHVVEGDLIAEIETDKATMGLEASEEGYLAKIIVAEKTKDIPLKTLLCIMVPNKADVAAFADFKPSDDHDAGAPAAPAAPAAAAAPPKPAPAPTSTPTPPPPPPPPAQQTHQQAAPRAAGTRVFATPLAKKLAAERNIDLSLVTPTGPDNQVRAQDIINYASSTPSAPSPARSAAPGSSASSGGDYEDIAVNNYRAVTAKRLTQSKQTIPHYYLTVDLEIDQALKIRKDLNEQFAKTGETDGTNLKLSVNDFVIKAAALACKKVPEANSAWMDTHIRKHNTVDVCVAVATENGLITPIVFNADKKGLSSISFDVGVLAKKARDNKLQPHEFQGGTFTISNLGMFGIKSFAAVINPPQSCILAVGGTEKRVVPTDEKGTGHRVATYLTVTLSCDHRVVDGAVGAKWLQYFKKYMENPASMLL